VKITIGTSTDGKPVSFDLDKLLLTRLLIQANSGAGKSWVLRVLIEQLFGHVQVIVIDPEGEFATLREKFDFVLVGKEGADTPADVRSAELLAHKLLEIRASAVCDLYEMRPSDRHKWVHLFLEAMIDAPKKLWHPVVVVVDEAQLFCPEKGAGESEASEAMVSLTTRGRKRGYCAVWATQRLANLKKDATSMLLNRLVGGTFEDVDIKRALDLLSVPTEKKERSAFALQLRTLEPGMFYALGRAIAKERLLFKSGKVQTSHPQPGSSKHAAAPPPTPEKIRDLLPKLADLPQTAEEKARTVAELQRELREVKTQLRVAEKAKPAAPQIDQAATAREVEKAVRTALGERDKNWLRAVRDYQRALNAGFAVAVAQVGEAIDQVKFETPAEANVTVSVEKLQRAAIRPTTRRPIQHRERAAPVVNNSNGSGSESHDLGKGERKMLVAIAQHEDGATRAQLTQLTGFKRSTRNAYIQRLCAAGLARTEGTNSPVFATDEGIAALGSDYEPLPTGDELREYWLRKLPDGERKTLEVLAQCYPAPLQREAVSECTGFARSTRNAYIQRLVARRLVTLPTKDEVKVADELFG
jgi:hypothetical protein